MSDFDERLSRALADGAEDAPVAHALADRARTRLGSRRRRSAVAGSMAAVVAIVVSAAVLTGNGGDRSGPGFVDEPPPAPDDVMVTCGGDTSWPVSAMEGGVANDVADSDVRDAFARLREEAGIDAPPAIQEQGADASYVVLAVTDSTVTVGVGEWTLDGPQRDAMVVGLEESEDGLRAGGWGDCGTLEIALPDGRSRVEVTAQESGVDPTTSSPEVLVHEVQCTSGRDPQPYLAEPTVVEEEDRVLVTVTSDEMVGGADCQGNPSVALTLDLDEPLGDRRIFDAGTWPPTPIEVAQGGA